MPNPAGQQRAREQLDAAIEWYQAWREKNPEAKAVADFMPVVGQITSAADALAAQKDGDYAAAAINAAGILPLMQYATKASGAIKAARATAGAPDWLVKANNMARGASVADDVAGSGEAIAEKYAGK